MLSQSLCALNIEIKLFPFALGEVSVLAERALRHLRYSLTDVPPQSNSLPGSLLELDHAGVLLAIGREGLTTTLIRLALEHSDNRVETPAPALRPTE